MHLFRRRLSESELVKAREGILALEEQERNREDICFSVNMSFSEWNEDTPKSPSFSDLLRDEMAKRDLSNVAFYKAARIDRKLFSAMFAKADYLPGKLTVVQCCLGLHADLDTASTLMEAAGYSFSLNLKRDRIFYYCIMNGIFDIDDVNDILLDQGEKVIG